MTCHSFFSNQLRPREKKLLKADKDYDYDVLLCFASFEQNKHNNGGNYCGAEAWGQFWDIKEMRELGKKVNVANLNVTQAHSCSPFFSFPLCVF
jgi:hypothetical protein